MKICSILQGREGGSVSAWNIRVEHGCALNFLIREENFILFGNFARIQIGGIEGRKTNMPIMATIIATGYFFKFD